MAFSSADLDAMLIAHDAIDVAVLLNGVTVETIKAIFRERVEVVFADNGLTGGRPALVAKYSDLVRFNREHTFTASSVSYRAFGPPTARNSGLATQPLVLA